METSHVFTQDGNKPHIETSHVFTQGGIPETNTARTWNAVARHNTAGGEERRP